MNVNFYGTYHMVRNFLKHYHHNTNTMRIINTASDLGLFVRSMLTAYEVSKHAVTAFTEALSLELREQGHSHVTAHLFIPHFVESNLIRFERHLPEGEHAFTSQNAKPLRHEMAKKTLSGISPKAAAQILFNGVKGSRFYIYSDPETSKQFQQRADAIIHDSNLKEFPKSAL